MKAGFPVATRIPSGPLSRIGWFKEHRSGLSEGSIVIYSLDSQAHRFRGFCLAGRVAVGGTAPPEWAFELRLGRRWPVDQPSRLRNANVAGMHAMPRRGAWPPTIDQHRAGMRWPVEALGPSCSFSLQSPSPFPDANREDPHDVQESELPFGR